MLFSKSRAQSRESVRSSDFSSLASGVQAGQNMLDDSQEDELNGNQPLPKERKQSLKRNGPRKSPISYIKG